MQKICSMWTEQANSLILASHSNAPTKIIYITKKCSVGVGVDFIQVDRIKM